METIKIRKGIFETNSSSSHSFSIKSSGRFTQTLEKEADGKIYIGDDLWESCNKSNDPAVKLSYLLSLVYTWCDNEFEIDYADFNDEFEAERDHESKVLQEFQERAKPIISVVCDFTGAKGVVFIPESKIDHESTDIFDKRDVFDPEFIKEFVFSEESWIYPIWDSFEEGEGFYEDDRSTILMTLKFEKGIPDLPLDFESCRGSWEGRNYKIMRHLNGYMYDPGKDEFVPVKYDKRTAEKKYYFYSGDFKYTELVQGGVGKVYTIKVEVCPE